MERRRISFDPPKPSQQELPLDPAPPRRRITFDLSPTAEVHLRMEKESAAAVRANPEGAVKHLAMEAQRMLNELCTAWSRDRPPSSGYWELKQRSAVAPDPHNWWYSAPLNAWHRGVPQTDSRLASFVAHGALMQGYEWRGLKKPHPDGYSYELTQAAFAREPVLGNTADETVKREGAFAAAPLPDLNPVRRRLAL